MEIFFLSLIPTNENFQFDPNRIVFKHQADRKIRRQPDQDFCEAQLGQLAGHRSDRHGSSPQVRINFKNKVY